MTDVDKISRSRKTAAEAAGARRKRRRRGKRTLYYILILLFLLAAGIALSLTVFFKIVSITVTGTDKYPPEDIVDTSGIKPGDNMLRIRFKEAREQILEQYPYVGSVQIKLKPTGDVRIELTQCEPAWALLEADGEVVMITREGKALERGIIFIPENVPVVKGIEAAGVSPGGMLDGDLAEVLNILEYFLRAIEKTEFIGITNIDLTDRYNLKIVYENRLLFKLGTESELADKLEFIKRTVESRFEKDAEGVIDASDINVSLNYMPMPIGDALEGRKRAAAQTDPAQNNPKEDSEMDEPETEPVTADGQAVP